MPSRQSDIMRPISESERYISSGYIILYSDAKISPHQHLQSRYRKRMIIANNSKNTEILRLSSSRKRRFIDFIAIRLRRPAFINNYLNNINCEMHQK